MITRRASAQTAAILILSVLIFSGCQAKPGPFPAVHARTQPIRHQHVEPI